MQSPVRARGGRGRRRVVDGRRGAGGRGVGRGEGRKLAGGRGHLALEAVVGGVARGEVGRLGGQSWKALKGLESESGGEVC